MLNIDFWLVLTLGPVRVCLGHLTQKPNDKLGCNIISVNMNARHDCTACRCAAPAQLPVRGLLAAYQACASECAPAPLETAARRCGRTELHPPSPASPSSLDA
eukprot:357758-Chlamydomonas_euryale.AAC.2